MKLRFRYFRSLRNIAVASLFSTLLGTVAFANNPIPQVVGPPVPQAVVPGSGEFTLTVYGANFVSGAVVNWNRSPRSTTFVSTRGLKAQILASDVAKPTAGCITVTNPPPSGGVSSSSYAIVEVHKPTKTINPGQYNQYFSGNVPWYAVAADFTNDGKLDLFHMFPPKPRLNTLGLPVMQPHSLLWSRSKIQPEQSMKTEATIGTVLFVLEHTVAQ